ncbi:Holliday junction resolvase RuvX [Mycoplasma phocoenae]|uniref:Putative pre-16S rRNA nuclease n=1 Tax=Mycoplasma phocoenae TaxID=754517 RepID=A0A858U4Q0_9MOLU|nr:Holliday junction resolvase RuvX [Mycoplasma phocoenae]QJG67021.1 Holliday junction resolvase RuvX [Mycoplasma phocoenae]
MRKLSLDLGTRTCGFAITDSDCILATGLDNYRFEENNFSKVVEQVKFYIEKYKDIDTLVLGHPLRSNNTKSERTLMVEEFKIILENEFKLPVVLVNEHSSTKAAEDILIQVGYTRKKRKGVKDKLAAQLILEDYLNYYLKK